LLYKLKRYAPNDEIQQNINDKINEIIDAFKNSILGVSPLAGTAMNTEQTDAYTRGYNDGLNGNGPAKSAGGIEDSISRAYDLGFNTGKEDMEKQTIYGTPPQTGISSQTNTNVSGKRRLSNYQGEPNSDFIRQRPSNPPPSVRGQNFPSGTTKSGIIYRLPFKGGICNNSTRKRNPSKIPRRTIRRGRPRRGQKRTQKRKQKPRRTIRRRNKKGTQKRRK
jgi:hypothetical protein